MRKAKETTLSVDLLIEVKETEGHKIMTITNKPLWKPKIIGGETDQITVRTLTTKKTSTLTETEKERNSLVLKKPDIMISNKTRANLPTLIGRTSSINKDRTRMAQITKTDGKNNFLATLKAKISKIRDSKDKIHLGGTKGQIDNGIKRTQGRTSHGRTKDQTNDGIGTIIGKIKTHKIGQLVQNKDEKTS
jgi:hypothetical protein